jgi:hypothetical protein
MSEIAILGMFLLVAFAAIVDHLVQRKATSAPPARRDGRLSGSCTGDDPAMSETSKLARRAY